jgi:hypothetical protein
MRIPLHTINDLKAAGHYYAAGVLAYALRQPNNYGCHFGMRSELEKAKEEFSIGWLAAHHRP